MATSEFIRRNVPAGQPTQQVAKSRRVPGPAFASKLLQMSGDLVVVSLAFVVAIALKIRFFSNGIGANSIHSGVTLVYLAFFGWFLVSLIVLSEHYGLYNSVSSASGTHDLRLTIQASLIAGLLLCGGLYMAHWEMASRAVVLLLIGTTAISLCAWRTIVRFTRYRNYEKGVHTRNVVILGTNYLGQALGQHIAHNYRLGYKFLGYISPWDSSGNEDVSAENRLGNISQLRQLTRLHFIDEVVITHALPSEQAILLIEEARELGIDIRAISGLYGDLSANGTIEYLGLYPVTALHRSQSRTFSIFFKRVFDIAFSLTMLIAITPLMLMIALAVRLDSQGPTFYVSERVGKRGRTFLCFKFRTMVKDAEKKKRELAALNERDGILFKVSNDPRVTRVGRILRKYSLDELPQFFNVFRGEMSVVGPRPPIASEVEKYELEHFRRLEVTPGLTGLWQVHARQDSSFAKYIELDTAYVENWSFWLDVKILMRTAHVVVRGTGA